LFYNIGPWFALAKLFFKVYPGRDTNLGAFVFLLVSNILPLSHSGPLVLAKPFYYHQGSYTLAKLEPVTMSEYKNAHQTFLAN